MYFKAVIFDLDGTVLDTLADLKNAVNFTCRNHGYKEHTLNYIRMAVGNGMRNLIKKSLPTQVHDDDALVDACTLEMKNYYFENCKTDTRPYDGIDELLAFLKENKISASILSNKPDYLTREIIPHYFGDTFDFVYGEREGIPRKPDPTSALALAHEIGAEPDKILFVGDSSYDMLTAKNAGMFAAGVTWGFRDEKDLTEAGADFIAHKPQDLINLVMTYQP